MQTYLTLTINYSDGTQKHITLIEDVHELSQRILVAHSQAKSIRIPEGIERITHKTFEQFKQLEAIHIPNSVTTISIGAFADCTRLATVNLPAALTTIDNGAFWCCSSLTSLSLPTSLTAIGDGAFYGCTSLTSISLPASLSTIGDGAFRHCKNLTAIALPSSLTTIGESAFWDCMDLSHILTSQTPSHDILHILPHGVNLITIDTLIPSLQNAALAQKDVALSLIDLNASSFNLPPTLHLRKQGLQQIANHPHANILNQIFPYIDTTSIKKVFYNAYRLLSLLELPSTLSLDNPTYTFIRDAFLKPLKADDSNNYLLQVFENLSLKDLASFARTSKKPLQGLHESEKSSDPQTPIKKRYSPSAFFTPAPYESASCTP